MKKLWPLLICLALLSGCFSNRADPTVPTLPSQPTQSTQPATVPPTTVPPTTHPTEPTEPAEPQAETFLFSFAGDCTFGNQHGKENFEYGFLKVVGVDYDYPLSNVRNFFVEDEYSFVNLECALTEYDPDPAEMQRYELTDKLYRFRGPAAYAKILSGSGVEFANTSNNHIYDYAYQGYKDTLAALDEEGITHVDATKTCVAVTGSGLRIGIISVYFACMESEMKQYVHSLREQNVDLIVLSIHWGDEGSYMPNERQRQIAYMAIDNGVNIVHGHHSHTLQPVEYYNGGMIYFSLGNFSFGGNVLPSDKDTAILQQEVIREPDGTVHLGGLRIIPCRVSSITERNDFRPTPYEESDPAFQRTLAKLTGTFESGKSPR